VEISFSHGASQMADLSFGGGTQTVKVSSFEVRCNPIVHCKFGPHKNGINNSSNEIIFTSWEYKYQNRTLVHPKIKYEYLFFLEIYLFGSELYKQN